MGKRTWMIFITALALSLLASACGSSNLAEDLTPIPTLAPGETPALVDALAQAPATQEASGEADGEGGGDALVAAGQELFAQACAGCHGAQDGAGPALTGMADRAETRVEGMSAEDYLHESIVAPSAHVVEGYADIMPKNYGDDYSDEQIDSLVAYIMVAGSEEGAAEDAESDEEATEEAEATEDAEATEEAEVTEEPAEEADAEAEATDDGADEGAAVAVGDASAGEGVFTQNCAGCHGAQDGAGPALTGMGERAETRVEGMSAEEYLHESVVDPSAYIVPGFADIMPKQYEEQLSEDEIANLIAFMLEH